MINKNNNDKISNLVDQLVHNKKSNVTTIEDKDYVYTSPTPSSIARDELDEIMKEFKQLEEVKKKITFSEFSYFEPLFIKQDYSLLNNDEKLFLYNLRNEWTKRIDSFSDISIIDDNSGEVICVIPAEKQKLNTIGENHVGFLDTYSTLSANKQDTKKVLTDIYKAMLLYNNDKIKLEKDEKGFIKVTPTEEVERDVMSKEIDTLYKLNPNAELIKNIEANLNTQKQEEEVVTETNNSITEVKLVFDDE